VVACDFAHGRVRDARLTADVGRTAFLTISDTGTTGHARFSHRQKRQPFAILRAVQTQPKSRGKPSVENYLRLIQALFRSQTIPWLSHAMHPRASAAIKNARRPGPDYFEPRIGSTGFDAHPFGTHLSSPPDSDSRHLLKCHLRRTRQPKTA
jgi:hypothetical protein